MLPAIVICISAFVTDPDARVLAQATHARGWSSYHMLHTDSSDGCTAVVYSAEADQAYSTHMFFDGEVHEDTGKRRRLTRKRAADLLTAWTAQPSFKALCRGAR
jgi:hypothetical protein